MDQPIAEVPIPGHQCRCPFARLTASRTSGALLLCFLACCAGIYLLPGRLSLLAAGLSVVLACVLMMIMFRPGRR